MIKAEEFKEKEHRIRYRPGFRITFAYIVDRGRDRKQVGVPVIVTIHDRSENYLLVSFGNKEEVVIQVGELRRMVEDDEVVILGAEKASE